MASERKVVEPAAGVRKRIELDRPNDIRRWAEKFAVSPRQIEAAVREVGGWADAVEMHLKGTRSTSNDDRVNPGAEPVGAPPQSNHKE